MNQIVDQCGRAVAMNGTPQRIVSLYPAATESLFSLIEPERIVGITTDCRYPARHTQNTRKVGSASRADLDAVAAVQPDLVIMAQGDIHQEDVEAMDGVYPLLILNPLSVDHALDGLRLLGKVVSAEERANGQAEAIGGTWSRVKRAPALRTLYLVWRDPYVAAGAGTYIDSVMNHFGLINAAADLPGTYPEISEEWILDASIDLVLTASEPYPFEERHVDELQVIRPDVHMRMVSAQAFSWPGAAMKRCVPYLSALMGQLNGLDRT